MQPELARAAEILRQAAQYIEVFYPYGGLMHQGNAVDGPTLVESCRELAQALDGKRESPEQDAAQ